MRTAKPAPVTRMVPQRHTSDCTVAALAMWVGVPYEDALLALGSETPTVRARGAWFTQLKRAAERFGMPTRRKTSVNLEDDDGVLQVGTPGGDLHAVLLRQGLIFDTDGCVWEPDDFFAATGYKPRAVLVKEEE
jgi:hypothetical protein